MVLSGTIFCCPMPAFCNTWSLVDAGKKADKNDKCISLQMAYGLLKKLQWLVLVSVQRA